MTASYPAPKPSHQRGLRIMGRLLLLGIGVSTGVFARAQDANASTRHVPAEYPTIQAAINAAVVDDEILVAPGTYPEHLDTQGKRLSLRSVAGASVTVVDGSLTGRVLTITGGGLVDGFTLQNGRHPITGGGIYCSSGSASTTIRNNIIRNNIAGTPDQGDGGGIAIEFSNPVLVELNTIANNYAGGQGGGVFAKGNGHLIQDNALTGNRADVSGGAVAIYLGTLRRNLVTANIALYFAAGVLGFECAIEANTVVGNRNINNTDDAAGILAQQGGAVRWNITAFNIGGGIGWDVSHPPVECNDSWGNTDAAFIGTPSDTVGRLNASADPLFCDQSHSDFRLNAGSPCAPGSTPSCGLIGALPVGCGTVAARREPWGAIKVRYR